MLLRDQMEPLAQYFAHCLVRNGVVPGSAWNGYDCGLPDDNGRIRRSDADLNPLKQTADNEVWYTWCKNGEARIGLVDITFEDLDPNNFDMSERIILSSKLKASDVIPFTNGTTEVQDAVIEHWEETGENEIMSIMAGFEKKTTVSAEASGGVEGIAEVKASVVDETTLRSSFEKTTGRKTNKRAGGTFTFRQPPMTEGEARLTWSEQKMQTRVKGFRQIRCKVVIGRFHSYKKYDPKKAKRTTRHSWTTGSPVTFADVTALIDVMEKKGSVHTPFFEHFASRNTDLAYPRALRKLIRQNVDFLTEPFSGANEFKPEIVTSSSMGEPRTDLVDDE